MVYTSFKIVLYLHMTLIINFFFLANFNPHKLLRNINIFCLYFRKQKYCFKFFAFFVIFAISTIIYCHVHTFLHKNIFIEIFVTINKIKCLREKYFNIKIKIYRISVFFIWKKEICRARRFNIYIKRLKLSTFTKKKT